MTVKHHTCFHPSLCRHTCVILSILSILASLVFWNLSDFNPSHKIRHLWPPRMSSLTLGIRLVGVQTPEYLLCVGFLTKIDYSIDSITKIIMRNVHPAQTQTWTGVVALEQSADGTWFMGQLQKKNKFGPLSSAVPEQTQRTRQWQHLYSHKLAQQHTSSAWLETVWQKNDDSNLCIQDPFHFFKRTPRAYPASCVKPSFLAHAQLGLRTSFEPFHATKQCESCVQRLGQNFEALPWVLVWILTWHMFYSWRILAKIFPAAPTARARTSRADRTSKKFLKIWQDNSN